MAEQKEVLLDSDRKPEVTAVLQLIDGMTVAEQKEVMIFIQGMVFAKNIKRAGEKE